MRNSFKDLTFEELLAKREQVKAQYRDLRFQRVVGHVDNPVQKRIVRRQIARLNTLIYNHAEVVGQTAQAGASEE